MKIRPAKIPSSPAPLAASSPVAPPNRPLLSGVWEFEQQRQREARRRMLDDCPPLLAAHAAEFCALVYRPLQEVKTQLEQLGAESISPWDNQGTQAIGFVFQNRLWLVFRGTDGAPETEMFRDWGHDLLAIPAGLPPRHLGFEKAWRKIRQPVLTWSHSHANRGPMVLTGHSLGGALVLLAANALVDAGLLDFEAVITFGAPRVGSWFWTRAYHQKKVRVPDPCKTNQTLRDVTWRIHNWGDAVTYVPFLIFSHCGKSIAFHPVKPPPILLPPSGMIPRAENGWLGALERGYQMARTNLPYNPLALFVDTLLLARDTPAKHFMKMYGAGFDGEKILPPLPIKDTPHRRTVLDQVLRVVKWLIILFFLAVVGALGVVAFRLAPPLAILLLVWTAIGALESFTPGKH